MSDPENVLNILKETNPFSSSSAGNPWADRYPDVPGLGEGEFQDVLKLIGYKAQNPASPHAGLVLGDAGSGKTHLICRLFDNSQNSTQPYSCAYIQPIIDHHKAFRYLLREIVTSLVRKKNEKTDVSVFERISAGILSRVFKETAGTTKKKLLKQKLLKAVEILDSSPGNVFKLNFPQKSRDNWVEKTKTVLSNRHQDLDPEFLTVFVQYIFFPDRRMRAINWFKGYALPDEDIKLLGVTDRSRMEPSTLEAEAQDILLSLDTLMNQYTDRPLAVFFDQLENLQTDHLIHKFCQLVYFLCDQCRAMLPVAFFREILWDTEFKQKIDKSCSQRLEANPISIYGANKQQAIELVKSRLDHVLGSTPRPHALYPFFPEYKEEFDKIFAYGEIFPRQVLIRSNNLLGKIINGTAGVTKSGPGSGDQSIDLPEEIDPIKILQDKFDSNHQEILAKLDDYPPDEGRLTLALEQYLKNRPDTETYRFEDLKWSPEDVKYIDLSGTLIRKGGKEADTVFIVDVELNHSSVRASLNRGIKHMEAHNTKGRALYIRDRRCKFLETWIKTNQLLDRLKQVNGGAVFLDDTQAARWYALARLKHDVVAGDIADRKGRTIGEAEYRKFIREKVNGDAYPSFKAIDHYFKGEPIGKTASEPTPKAEDKAQPKAPADSGFDYNEISKTAMGVLDKSPAKMMKAQFLAAKVGKKLTLSPALDSDMLLSALNKAGKSEMFSIYGSPPGVIIQLRVSKYHGQS
ncbi:MAG: hypothetical protein U9P10_11135 [Thermodesulfobacteriota bacterium]|nr:hypothetical protein [Thermodesulfobacteriota bacterium]